MFGASERVPFAMLGNVKMLKDHIYHLRLYHMQPIQIKNKSVTRFDPSYILLLMSQNSSKDFCMPKIVNHELGRWQTTFPFWVF